MIERGGGSSSRRFSPQGEMHVKMQMGSNAPIGGNALTISWQENPVGADVDICAYLLAASGKVRGDEDMVFYGQPQVPSITMTTSGTRAEFKIDFASIPDDIEKIAI